MKSNAAIWCLFVAVIHSVCSAGDNDALTIKISNGLLKGKDNNGVFYSWESIPYAEPPLGKLRFEAPQPYENKWTQVFDATVKSQHCMQWDQFVIGKNKLHGVEDCLTVNVYKPKVKSVNKFPVMVFLHGGCFMFGGVNAFQPDLLMASGKMILVMISYRLGPLGFLSTEDEAITGNFGLKDQQLALKWTKANIDKFGGDPNKIMLTGFSAGGGSTHLHMLHTSLQDMAKSAVSLSRQARKNAFKLSALLNCSSSLETTDTLQVKHCLQQKKAEDIVTAVKEFHNFGYNPFTTFGPVVEHKKAAQAFLTEHPVDIIKSGNISQIPWLVSYTSEDGGYNAAELLQINPQTGKEVIYDLNDQWLELAPQNLFLGNIDDEPQSYARKLKETYLGEQPFSVENYLKVQEMYTDVLFKDGILDSMKLHSQYSKSPVYGYVYDNPADYSLGNYLSHGKDIAFGTNHIDDLSLILNSAVSSSPRPDEVIGFQKLIQMLVDFADTGKLAYGNCDFENNTGRDSKHLKLMLITKDNECKSVLQNV